MELMIGTKRYYERNQKVAYGQTLEYYIKKYGEVEGSERFLKRQTNLKLALNKKHKRTSKSQISIYTELLKTYNKMALEYVTKYGTVDMYDKENNVIIEFYGDYWHCNPLKYSDDFYNSNLHMTAKEKHEFDKKRILNIINDIQPNKVIIIWENTYVQDGLSKIIEKVNSIITQNVKGIIWV